MDSRNYEMSRQVNRFNHSAQYNNPIQNGGHAATRQCQNDFNPAYNITEMIITKATTVKLKSQDF